MSQWNKLELPSYDLGTSKLSTVLDKIRAFLGAVVDFLKIAAKVISGLTDPITTLIAQTIDELLRIVEGYLGDAGIYLLPVPVRKRLATEFLGIGDFTPTVASSTGIFGNSYSAHAVQNPELNQFLASANRYSGGNAGFFRTVVESLNDEGDVNRPQFHASEDRIGGMTFMVGSQDPVGFLDDLWKLAGMFGIAGGLSDSLPQIPRPQNLRAKAMSTANGGKFNVMLTWDPVTTALTQLRDLGGVLLIPERYAVIRVKNDATMLGATTVPEIMGTRDIKKGDTFANGTVEVIEETAWDLADVSYVDEDVPASHKDSYYYTVAWKLRVYGDQSEVSQRLGKLLDYYYISNVARVTPYPMLPGSTPPDWVRTPSLGSVFPALANVVQKLSLQITALAKKALGASDLLSAYVAFLEREVARYSRLANEILNEVQRLNAMLQLPSSGIYVRQFEGEGGNDFFVSDLARSLLTSFPSAPPFHRGDEYVAGAILLVGGPQSNVSSSLDLLRTLFGGGSQSTESLDNLTAAVSQLEEKTFTDDFQPGGSESASHFAEDFREIKRCSQPPEAETRFGDNFGENQ